jgi:hypothetical protein
MKIYIQMSNAGRVCGVWDSRPSDEERAKAYSLYLGKEVDAEATRWSTWIEEHEVQTHAAL